MRARILWFTLTYVCAAVGPARGGDARWIRMQSPNFQIYSTAGERNTRDTLQYFEQVRSFFAQSMTARVEKPLPVRIIAFSSLKEYEPYRFNEFAIAYYHGTPECDYIVMSQTGAETFPVAIHEYVHVVLRHAKLEFPPWLNEGLAELYSTLKPLGGKILVGNLIPGRHQALLAEKWVPLAVILAAGQNSPYYNEKNKAGNLYNESWALTHMLALSRDYRPKFPEVMLAIQGGTPSAEALEKVYGKPLAVIERELQGYLRGGSFQGILFPAKLDKTGDEITAEAAPLFDVKLLLAELSNRPGKELEAAKRLEELASESPERPEPFTALGYLAWRQRHTDEARENFAKAFALGSRNPRMLWDYGRMAERNNAPDSTRALGELLRLEPERVDVRLELASVQLSAQQAQAALVTIAPIRKVGEADAPRLFTIMAHAQLQNGDRKSAREAAERLATLAKTPADKAEADRLLKYLDGPPSSPARSGIALPAESQLEDRRPPLQRREPPRLVGESSAPRLEIAGTFVEFDCAPQPKVLLKAEGGKKVFLIEDPNQISVLGRSGGTVELTCGPQHPVAVRIEYTRPEANRTGIDGILRVIHFEQ